MRDMDIFLQKIGYTTNGEIDTYHRTIIIIAILLFSVLAYYFCKKIIIPLLQRIVAHTSARWDDHLLNTKVMHAACLLVPFVIIYLLIPVALSDSPLLLLIITKICLVAIIAVCARLVCNFISSFYVISSESEKLRKKPLKGLYQMLKIVVICIALILIFSTLLDRRPEVLLAGLGASAAVLMLVFKDSIMGLVAGVQLNVYDMLRPGDWIIMEKHGANGIVSEVSLNIIKIVNWDNSIITIPTYTLVSDSFQNWRNMRESGGRRIAEQIYINIRSIHQCTAEEIQQYQELTGKNPEYPTPPTNLHFFRYYLENFLLNNPEITPNPHLMVRLRPSTPQGLPVEIYCFTTNVDWIPYEHLKAEILEFAYSSLSTFGLIAFQQPAGIDIAALFPESLPDQNK